MNLEQQDPTEKHYGDVGILVRYKYNNNKNNYNNNNKIILTLPVLHSHIAACQSTINSLTLIF